MLTEEFRLDVAPERVYSAWTESAHLIAWWGDGTEFRTTHWVGDLRVGGAWRVQFVDPRGNAFSAGGEYLRVEPPTRLSFTWKPEWDTDPPTTVELEFRATANGTLLLLKQFGFANAAALDQHRQAWGPMVLWLRRHLTSL